jgi:hypothetical protein
MARKAAKNQTKSSNSEPRDAEVEASVIALAEQLGSFLGQVTAKAEGWLDNDMLRAQATQIQKGAGELLKRVNTAGASAKETMAKAKKTVVKAATSVRSAKPAEAPKQRPSRGPVDAPGKKHRKPPPQQKVDRRGREPGGPMGQQGMKGRMQRGRG